MCVIGYGGFQQNQYLMLGPSKYVLNNSCAHVQLLFFHVDNTEVAALVLLPTLIPEARVKVDVGKIIHVDKVYEIMFT